LHEKILEFDINNLKEKFTFNKVANRQMDLVLYSTGYKLIILATRNGSIKKNAWFEENFLSCITCSIISREGLRRVR